MSDLIDREAAIDAVRKNTFRLTFAEEQYCEGHVAWSADAVYSDAMKGALLELPSAQPEILACGEGELNVSDTNDGDIISRRAAIDALRYERKKLNEFMDKCLATGEYGLRAGAKTEWNRIEEDIYILENMPPAQQWTPCCKGMPDEQYSDTIGDFKYILCTTIWGDVRPYKYGTPIGGDAPHFWHGPQAMDEKVVAWAYMPLPYTEGENG